TSRRSQRPPAAACPVHGRPGCQSRRPRPLPSAVRSSVLGQPIAEGAVEHSTLLDLRRPCSGLTAQRLKAVGRRRDHGTDELVVEVKGVKGDLAPDHHLAWLTNLEVHLRALFELCLLTNFLGDRELPALADRSAKALLGGLLFQARHLHSSCE